MQNMHTGILPNMQKGAHNLLTAQQVQQMLEVDRSTIYRMAEDGRLPAIKVGRQWRFPAESIAELLTPEGGRPVALPGVGDDPDDVLVAGARTVVAVSADLLGVMMVVTDMDGRQLTSVANPCEWFADRVDDPETVAACTAEWQLMADDLDFEPRFRTGALGFQCARALVRSGSSLVAMVLAGGIAPEGSGTPGLYHLDDAERARVLASLPKVAAALSRVPPRRPFDHGST